MDGIERLEYRLALTNERLDGLERRLGPGSEEPEEEG